VVVNLKAMLNFRKFKNGTKAEVDEQLKHEKEKYPNMIVYGFGISHEHPGNFVLSYIRNTNPHHEYVNIHPKGFKFRKQVFETIELLVAYFQKHINDNVALAKSSTKVGSGSDSWSAGGWRNSNGDHHSEPKGITSTLKVVYFDAFNLLNTQPLKFRNLHFMISNIMFS